MKKYSKLSSAAFVYWHLKVIHKQGSNAHCLSLSPSYDPDMTETLLRRMCNITIVIYCKNSKNWDTLNYHRDCLTNGIVAFYSAILRSKDSDRITNRVDTDQTAP